MIPIFRWVFAPFNHNHIWRSFGTKSMKFLKQQEAIDIDQALFTEYAFSVDQLMELAGLSCAQAIASVYQKGNVLILSGPGNNGGDGLVCARHLKHFGFNPSIFYTKPSKNEQMQRLVKQAQHLDIPFLHSFPDSIMHFNLIVDALFGFSFRPPVRDPFGEILQKVFLVQTNAVPLVSIDIPSGWDVENGPPAEDSGVAAIEPSALISLTAPKLCAKYFKGKYHFLGGRFVPPSLAQKYGLDLPPYEGSSQFLRLTE